MKKFLFAALLAFLFSLPAHSQTIAGTLTVQGSTLNCSSLTGRNTSAISIAVNNSQTNVTFVLSGTWVGTVKFYGTTNNGIQWSALSVTPTGGGSPVTSSTTNGSWGASVSTNTNFCAVATAYTSGNVFANATLTTSSSGGGNTTNQVVNGIPTNTGGDPTALDAIVCTPPATAGQFTVGYFPITAAAVAPTCPQVGLTPDAAAGASVLYSDNASVIYNPAAALAVPTPTTLGNPNFSTVIINNGAASTLTPATWTISRNGLTAGATAVVPSHSKCALTISQTVGTQWNLDCTINVGSCTEVWGGSGTSFAMSSGDDAISNNSCYNDSGMTRTITALKCRGDNASNTTVLTPTFGAAGTGTAILTGTLTCGNSYAYSATGTLSNTAWTTGTGIDPGMSTVGNATSIAMIVEYVY